MLCRQTCTCQNGASCNHIDGDCTCTAGWHGVHCEMMCEAGTYGLLCGQRCLCQNEARCDHVTGVCSCTPGWEGDHCEASCQSGKPNNSYINNNIFKDLYCISFLYLLVVILMFVVLFRTCVHNAMSCFWRS